MVVATDVPSRLVQAYSASLSEQRLGLLEDSIDLALSRGQHHEVIGQLMALAAEHSVRERPRALLVTALYRDGRQAEALEVYRQARETLVEELGLEPSRALQDLEQAILAGDPALDLAPGAEPSATAPRRVPPRRGNASPPRHGQDQVPGTSLGAVTHDPGGRRIDGLREY